MKIGYYILFLPILIYISITLYYVLRPYNPNIWETYTDNYVPEPPKGIESPDNPPSVKYTIQNLKSCGRCGETENMIRENKVMRDTNCELCNYIIRAWRRYYIVKNNVDRYKNGLLPEKPEISHHCSHSKEIENILNKYSKDMLSELDILKIGKYSNTTPLPRDDYTSKCEKCKNTFELLSLYTASLREIIKYVKSSKNK